MQCKNCGATIHEGDKFCRTCAVPVDISPYTGLEDISNPATDAFMRQNSLTPIQQEPIYKNEMFQNISAPVEPAVDEEANKKFVNKDGNDRIGATIRNVLGLVVLVIILFIIGKWLYGKVLINIF